LRLTRRCSCMRKRVEGAWGRLVFGTWRTRHCVATERQQVQVHVALAMHRTLQRRCCRRTMESWHSERHAFLLSVISTTSQFKRLHCRGAVPLDALGRNALTHVAQPAAGWRAMAAWVSYWSMTRHSRQASAKLISQIKAHAAVSKRLRLVLKCAFKAFRLGRGQHTPGQHTRGQHTRGRLLDASALSHDDDDDDDDSPTADARANSARIQRQAGAQDTTAVTTPVRRKHHQQLDPVLQISSLTSSRSSASPIVMTQPITQPRPNTRNTPRHAHFSHTTTPFSHTTTSRPHEWEEWGDQDSRRGDEERLYSSGVRHSAKHTQASGVRHRPWHTQALHALQDKVGSLEHHHTLVSTHSGNHTSRDLDIERLIHLEKQAVRALWSTSPSF